MLDDPDLGAVPWDPRGPCGQTGDEAEQIHRYLVSEIRWQHLGDPVPPARVGHHLPDGGGAAGGAVPRRCTEPRIPQHVIPVRMRRETRHHGGPDSPTCLARAASSALVIPGIDEQAACRALHDDGVALEELALVDLHTVRDVSQHHSSTLSPVISLEACAHLPGRAWASRPMGPRTGSPPAAISR
jgi:hypothetical protein